MTVRKRDRVIQRVITRAALSKFSLTEVFGDDGAIAVAVLTGPLLPAPHSSKGATNFGHVGWRGFDIRRALAERLGLPVIYNNDGNSAALYAHHVRFGAESGQWSSVAAIVGTGLGGGIIQAGQVVKGAAGMAGELGHVPASRPRGLGYGLAAGAGFGLFFLCLKNAGQSGVLWPVAVSRTAGTLIAFGIALATRTRPWRYAGGGTGVIALVSGAVDAAANVCYVLATRAGLSGWPS